LLMRWMTLILSSEGLPCAKEVAMAKMYIDQAYKEVTEGAIALHRGIGASRPHNIGLYYRRAKTASVTFGGTDFQRSW